MPKIILENQTAKIINSNQIKFHHIIDEELSFLLPGAQYSPAYKGFYNREGKFVKWDGKKHLLKNDLSFPLGLLERVLQLGQIYQVPFEIEDRRVKTNSEEISILPRLQELKKTPFSYQLEILASAEKKDHGIIRLATGGGKTLVAALMTARFGKSTVIYVIGKDLLHQIYNFFSLIFGSDVIGIIGDGQCEIKDITIASVWTVGQALGLKKGKILLDEEEEEEKVSEDKYKEIINFISHAKVHIFDECHIASCDTIQTIAQNINPERLYGLSASPWRDDNSDLLIEAVFGKYLIDVSASYLIREGYLVPPKIKFLRIPGSTEKLKKNYQAIYKAYITDNQVRNEYVLKAAQQLEKLNCQSLILYREIQHGKKLFDLIGKSLPVALLSGKDPQEKREKAKEDLQTGKISAILASTIFDIGVDIPSASGLITAGGGKSSVRALQRIGRVIRGYPNKKCAYVYDFLDQAHYLQQHAEQRKKIYELEPEFKVYWPKDEL